MPTHAPPRQSLLSRFTNTRHVFEERGVSSCASEVFHRHRAEHEEPTPACQRTARDDWEIVDVDEALKEGIGPCRNCWRPVLEYLAGEPSSPVEYREECVDSELDGQTSDDPLHRDRQPRAPTLQSLTDEVMINGGDAYHAPVDDGTLCGRSDYRVVDRVAVESHYRPCRDCFAHVNSP